MAIETMNISLPDTLLRYVEERVSEGDYGTTSEFIRELIRKERAERRKEAVAFLEREVLPAIESLERGEGLDPTPEFWDGIRAESRRRQRELQHGTEGT